MKRLAITADPGTGVPSQALLDGTDVTTRIRVATTRIAGNGIWIDGEPVYDVAVTINGEPLFEVGQNNDGTQAAYARLDALIDASPPPPSSSDFQPAAAILDDLDYIAAMPGRRALGRIDTLERIHGIFARNVEELQRHLARMDDPAEQLRLWDVTNRAALDEYARETERLVHNVVAAANTRVDLMRVFVRDEWAEDDPFITGEYAPRVATDFAGNGLHRFVTGLRNYMLHFRLPLSKNTIRYTAGQTTEHAFELPTEPLLAWENWHSIARAWLVDRGDAIGFGVAIEEYRELVADFDTWLATTLRETHEPDISEYEAAQHAFRQGFAT